MDSRALIIAEAGVNHNGSLDRAKKLIDVALQAGADAVKFQSFHAERLASVFAEKAAYQKSCSRDEESQFEMLSKLELNYQMHRELFDYASSKGIVIFSTPFDVESADMLEKLGVTLFKIGSGEITNIPFLKYVAEKKKPMILSTGMSTLDEVAVAVDAIRIAGNTDLTLLHCVSSYPVPLEEANVRAMIALRERFGVRVGYSDHTVDFEAALAAVAMGACVIEKHFTIDKKSDGPDHAASLDPLELQNFVKLVRRTELALGDGVKKPMQCELGNISVVRRSLFAFADIQKGTVIVPDMIESKRPAGGISPADLHRVVGGTAKHDIRRGEMLCWDSVET